MSRPRLMLAALAVVALALPACGGGDEGEGGGNSVSASLADFSIALDPTSAGAGSVTFNIKNDGANVHELVLFKTDLPEDGLPVEGDEVTETAEGLELVDEVEDLEPGASADLTMDLQAGSYVAVCNVTGHYAKGMHAAFTVT